MRRTLGEAEAALQDATVTFVRNRGDRGDHEFPDRVARRGQRRQQVSAGWQVELVDAPPTGSPRINLRAIACKDGSTIVPLTHRPGGIQTYKFVLPAGRDDEPALRTHEGYDWVYVLNGTLRLVLGEHDLILSPGEAAEFDTRIPHWSGPPAPGPPSSSAS